MAARKSIVGGPDVLIALYYGGAVGGLFDPIGPKPADHDFDVKFCEGVLAADPEHVEALAFLGNFHTRGGRHEEGLAIDLRLVRLRPDSPQVHYNLACSYALLGRPEEAMRDLERAVECGFEDAEHLVKD